MGEIHAGIGPTDCHSRHIVILSCTQDKIDRFLSYPQDKNTIFAKNLAYMDKESISPFANLSMSSLYYIENIFLGKATVRYIVP